MKLQMIFLFIFFVLASYSQNKENTLYENCVIWDSPSENSLGSMPAGNGDLGINFWVEENGDLLFYFSKTDAWNENSRLFKLGLIRLSLSPNPFAQGNLFRQELRLNEGIISVEGGTAQSPVSVDVWVDANHPVVEMKIKSTAPIEGSVSLEIWRNHRRKITNRTEVYSFPAEGAPGLYIEPDTILGAGEDHVMWAHRNRYSIWKKNLQLQALGEWIQQHEDPLLNRTFGGLIISREMTKSDDNTLKTNHPIKEFSISVFALTKQTDTLKEWEEALIRTASGTGKIPGKIRLDNHKKWWNNFWDRSYIRISTSDASLSETVRKINQGYLLQRYMNACSGRGNFPIKFNGSIFTVDTYNLPGEFNGFDADYRQWDGAYWFQNTRLPYWAMLAAGDFDLMSSLFKMYLDNIPIRKLATKKYYGHEGAFFPETFYFWGAYMDENYGTDREGKPDGLTDNGYIRRYWQGGLEMSLMMLEYYDMTKNHAFASDTLIPFVSEILTFFDQHWGRDPDGIIRFDPAQSLETWWVAVNPLPEIAGIRSVAGKITGLPPGLITFPQRMAWLRLLNDLPPLPLTEINGKKVLAPAEVYSDRKNIENPELYAVFPYRIFGIGKPDIDLAVRTFNSREVKGTGGWIQNAIKAACLGLSEEAASLVAMNFSATNTHYRWPAMWGPNYDWIPDQDHGSVAMIALQNMIIQSDENIVYLLPAWPKYWNVEFKLYGRNNQVFEGTYTSEEGLKIACKAPKGTMQIVNCMDGKEIQKINKVKKRKTQ